jgi:hypothetical protein
MKVTLSRQIPVFRCAVFAEMAWLERRPELGIICRKALENGRSLSSAIIATTLPGLSATGAANVMAWCKTLNICDERGGLGKIGEEVAQTDEAPVPEQGVYGLWIARHELFGTRILAVDRLSSRREQRLEEVRDLPMIPDRGKVFRSVLDPKERFVLRDIPTNHGQLGCILRETNAQCFLRWTLDFTAARNHWHLEGMIDGPPNGGKNAMRPMKHQSESENINLWDVASHWGNRELRSAGLWNSTEKRLAVPFAGLSEQEVEKFRKTVSIPQVEVPGKGVFADVKIEDVPIGPENAKDARSWALARFDRNIANKIEYRSRAQVREGFAALVKNTPLEAYEPTLPSHSQILQAYEKKREIYWSFAAPVDLSSHAVKEDELAAWRVQTGGAQ